MMPSEQLTQVREMIAAAHKISGAATNTFDLEGFRRSLVLDVISFPAGIEKKAVRIDGVACHWLCAPGADPAKRILYIHGGGFVAGGLETHGHLAGWLSQSTGYSVLFVDFRLAPEHPFPASLLDCRKVLRVIFDTGPDGQSPATSVLVAGDSAGGGMTITVMYAARQAGEKLPDAAILLCPMTNFDPQSPSLQKSNFLSAIASAYVGSANANDPLISPLKGDMTGLPPLIIHTSDADPFFGDAGALATAAAAKGVEVATKTWSGLPHVWHRFAPFLPEANEAVAEIGKQLAEKNTSERTR